MRFYRALLHLYPRSFRDEYAAEILSVIADRRDVAGPAGRIALAAETVGDTVANALRIHLEILLQDVRYTIRTLRRSPGFAMTAVTLTALGIGATTAALAVADHVLLRPLPFRDPERLIRFQGNDRTSPGGWNDLSPGNYRDLVARSTAIEAAAAYTGRSANLVGVGAPIRLDGQAATGELFEVLGVSAAIGRTFSREDQLEGAPDVIVLSHGAWRTYFGGDASVPGRSLLLNDRPHTVIGVMPEGFMFPDRDTQFWSVLKLAPASFEDRRHLSLHGGAPAPRPHPSAGRRRVRRHRDGSGAPVSAGERAAGGDNAGAARLSGTVDAHAGRRRRCRGALPAPDREHESREPPPEPQRLAPA